MFKLFDRKQGADNTYKCNRYVVVSTTRKRTFIAITFVKTMGSNSSEGECRRLSNQW